MSIVERLRLQHKLGVPFSKEAADHIEKLEHQNKELVEALRGLKWLAEPHFNAQTQLEQLKHCHELLTRIAKEDANGFD